ncbi:hypothetical protein ACFJIW_05095 [Tahibacter sp. UC22_41]|uniref:hypothetical protein n=1 Tax=Tahibacter sp. UC22_41 TaxID=3350178 RepID=UPI0036DB881E
MKIHVHIDRLVIDGAAHDGEAVRAALASALAQRLADASPGLSSFAVPNLSALAPAAPMHTAQALGSGVAQALHGALVPAAEPSR